MSSFIDGNFQQAIAYRMQRVYRLEKIRHESGVDPSANPYGTPQDALVKKPVDVNHDNPEAPNGRYGTLEKVWVRVAELVTKNNFDPERFIRAQFEFANRDKPAPRPNTMLASQAVENYTRSRVQFEADIGIALRTQKSTFHTAAIELQRLRMSPADSWLCVLGDTKLPLSALFRHCLAHNISSTHSGSAKFVKLADEFFITAALQYSYDAASYDAAWKQWIPEGFRRKADLAYRRYYRMEGRGYG